MNENEIILTANCIKALAGKPDSDELIQHLLKQMCTPSNESYPQQSASNISLILKYNLEPTCVYSCKGMYSKKLNAVIVSLDESNLDLYNIIEPQG